MPSTLEPTDHHGLFAIFKGESGAGKSVAALSFPKPYVMDFDVKMPSIALKHFPGKEIIWDTFPDIFVLTDKLNDLMLDCPYETIIADSFTGLASVVIASVAKTKNEPVPELLKRVKSGSIEMMGIDYYNAEDRYCNFFIEQLKRLYLKSGNPKHIIVTAHVVTVESSPDLKTKVVTRTRSIVSKGRKVGAWLPTGFDDMYIFYHEPPDLGEIDQTPRRIMITEAFGEDSAKCSFPFPRRIDFTNGNLFDKIKENL